MSRTDVINKIKAQGVYVLWSAWLVICLEWVSRSDLTGTLAWTVRHFPAFILSILLITCLLWILQGPIRNSRISFWIVAGVCSVVAFVSSVVLRTLGRPLLLDDIMVAGEVGDVAGVEQWISWWAVAGLVVFLAGSYVLVHRLTQPQQAGVRRRVLVAVGAAVILLSAFLNKPVPWDRAFALDRAASDATQTVRTDGLLLTELRQLRSRMVPQARPVLANLPVPVDQNDSPTPQPSQQVKPNIIVILSESLWDPTLLPGTKFEPDPLAFLHELQTSYPHGYLLSPEFGGSTANVELEVLTGLSKQFFPQGSIAYMQYIKKPTDSLASIAARQGYRTAAISPWRHSFFKSDEVYRSLGFGKFISLDFFPPQVGDYMSDSETTKMILDESKQGPGPFFIFANTAENHAAYYVGKFPENTVRVSGVQNDVVDGILETYAEGCKRADSMLRTLVTHFSEQKDPTIIVWFGDHLPVLGPDYQSYKETNYSTGSNDPDFLEKMHRVPVLVWSNYKPANPENLTFGTNFLGPYVLQQAGLTSTPFVDYLRTLQEKAPIVPPRRYWETLNLPVSALEEYEAIQRDLVSGDQVMYGPFKDQIINPNYILGHGPMTIDQVEVGTGGAAGDPVPVTFRGENLPVSGVVFVDGRPVATAWEGYETVKANLPHGAFTEVEIRVVDDEKKIIARSNTVAVTVP